MFTIGLKLDLIVVVVVVFVVVVCLFVVVVFFYRMVLNTKRISQLRLKKFPRKT